MSQTVFEESFNTLRPIKLKNITYEKGININGIKKNQKFRRSDFVDGIDLNCTDKKGNSTGEYLRIPIKNMLRDKHYRLRIYSEFYGTDTVFLYARFIRKINDLEYSAGNLMEVKLLNSNLCEIEFVAECESDVLEIITIPKIVRANKYNPNQYITIKNIELKEVFLLNDEQNLLSNSDFENYYHLPEWFSKSSVFYHMKSWNNFNYLTDSIVADNIPEKSVSGAYLKTVTQLLGYVEYVNLGSGHYYDYKGVEAKNGVGMVKLVSGNITKDSLIGCLQSKLKKYKEGVSSFDLNFWVNFSIPDSARFKLILSKERVFPNEIDVNQLDYVQVIEFNRNILGSQWQQISQRINVENQYSFFTLVFLSSNNKVVYVDDVELTKLD